LTKQIPASHIEGRLHVRVTFEKLIHASIESVDIQWAFTDQLWGEFRKSGSNS
jgi:hypothetical protein